MKYPDGIYIIFVILFTLYCTLCMNKDYDDDYATLMKTNLNLCDRHTCSNTSIPNTLRQSPNFYENLQTGAYENTILGAVALRFRTVLRGTILN